VINENLFGSYSLTVESGGTKSSYCWPNEPSGWGSGLPVTLTVAFALAEPKEPVTAMV